MKTVAAIPPDSKKMVDLCGSYPKAINAIMEFGRTMWSLAFASDPPGVSLPPSQSNYRIVDEKRLFAQWPPRKDELRQLLLNLLQTRELYWEKEGEKHCDLSVFQPVTLVRALLSGIRPDHELRYFTMRNIRQKYDCRQSSDTAHLFHSLADAINTRLLSEGVKQSWSYSKEFLPLLSEVLDKESQQPTIELFVECCRAVDYLTASSEDGCIELQTAGVDAELLLSKLFGMPTGIKGFDELFGGDGLMLTESLDAAEDSDGLKGRTVLIKGRFGTGKSLLSLSLAVEVARKGGLAWIMPLEQSAEECLYALESMRAFPRDGSVAVAVNVGEAWKVLEKTGDDERGALILLKTIKDSYEDFLSAFAENAKRMVGYPFCLIGVDPVNSISRDKGKLITDLRAETIEKIEEIKRAGINVLLVSEEETDPENELLFEQNIADTVIHLSEEKQYGYTQRYFEIMKSRFQREQRGKHPLSIVSGVGITIAPSSAAVSSRMRTQERRSPDTPIRFGLSSLDDILGEEAIAAGDTLVLQGQSGSFKTHLGLLFLLGADWEKNDSTPHRSLSLLVAARDSETTLRHILHQDFVHQHTGMPKNPEDIRICSLPHGHIIPGTG